MRILFENNSRYFNCPNLKYKNNEGREISYKERRFIPPVSKSLAVGEATVKPGERIDNFSARVLGDPLQFWRLCDTNNIMHPLELVNDDGRIIKIEMTNS